MTAPGDTTPLATRAILIAVLLITTASVGMLRFDSIGMGDAANISPTLWLLTGLFVTRVVGQVVVAIRPQRWLPPMWQWNLIPYPILLPIQLVFIALMIWINQAFSSGTGIAMVRNPTLGKFLIGFSAIYALVMAIRYVVRMRRRPDQRWFGGTIPIVFHFVLAAYVYLLGVFYVAD